MHIFIKVKKDILQEIEIPEGTKVSIDKKKVIIEGPLGKNEREFDIGKIKLDIKGNKISLENKKSTKNDKRNLKTISAHIVNLIKGVNSKFEYKLKICFNHFPFTVRIDGDKVFVKNFLGEKKERVVNIPKNVEIKMEKEFITVSSIDKEIAGQTAANLERITRIRNRDVRIFQDGMYIINKNGKEI